MARKDLAKTMTPFQRYVTRRAQVGGVDVRTNKIGDLYTGSGVNKGPASAGSRAGLKFQSGYTSGGRRVHLYNVGGNIERVVLPARKKKKTTPVAPAAPTVSGSTQQPLYP